MALGWNSDNMVVSLFHNWRYQEGGATLHWGINLSRSVQFSPGRDNRRKVNIPSFYTRAEKNTMRITSHMAISRKRKAAAHVMGMVCELYEGIQ